MSKQLRSKLITGTVEIRPRRVPAVTGRLASLVWLWLMLAVAGCAAFPTMTVDVPSQSRSDQDVQVANSESDVTDDNGVIRRAPQRLDIPGIVSPPPARQPATPAQIDALLTDESVTAVLAPQPVPQFAATVFGLLDLPYVLTSDVTSRTEIIAGGTGGNLSKRDLFRVAQKALQLYGIELFIDGGVVSVGRPEPSSSTPTVMRGRSGASATGQVVQIFPVETIEVNSLQSLIQGFFNSSGANVRITTDTASNTMILSGSARDVNQFISVLKELDRPRFAGGQVIRVEPVFLSAEQLAKSLEDALRVEGFLVSSNALVPRTIMIVPFQQSNQVLVFVRGDETAERVNYWVSSLDRPAALGDRATSFVYEVRNTDAQSLASLVIGQAPEVRTGSAPVGVPGAPPLGDAGARAQTVEATSQGPGTGQFMNGRVLADPIGNRIIFTGTATEYDQLRNLLNKLDVASPQVVIEVMIAEVTLTDSTSLGVNLFGADSRGGGLATYSTEGIAAGSGSFRFTFVGPDYRAALVANASNNRVNILQRPQLVTRSGGTARFQVGTDVPIITSQSASGAQTGGSTDILQSVQYRQTGTILDIKPVVYGDRVDLTINQELSSAGDAPAGISSPTILNRSLSTQIAVRDGWTGVLGGLISNNYTKNNVGVPFLKDVPIVGSAFQSNRVTGERTELILLITPYVVRDDEDMAAFAEAGATSIDIAFRTGRGWSYTLTPWSAGSRFRGVGLNLPSPQAAVAASDVLADRDRRDVSDSEAGSPDASQAATNSSPDN